MADQLPDDVQIRSVRSSHHLSDVWYVRSLSGHARVGRKERDPQAYTICSPIRTRLAMSVQKMGSVRCFLRVVRPSIADYDHGFLGVLNQFRDCLQEATQFYFPLVITEVGFVFACQRLVRIYEHSHPIAPSRSAGHMVGDRHEFVRPFRVE